MFRILITVALLALSACGQESPRLILESEALPLSIVGGQIVAPHADISLSVAAIVGHSQGGRYLCTGVLIGEHQILTAAHCGVNLQTAEIIFSTDLSTAGPELRRSVEKVELHSQYLKAKGQQSRNLGDIAIFSFSGSAPLGYQPVTIGDSRSLRDGQVVILAGYGLTDGMRQTESKNLRSVETPVQQARYSGSEFTVRGGDNKGPCYGDSGGPAFLRSGHRLLLVGITSAVFDASCQGDSLYTGVLAYKDWISKLLQSEKEQGTP